MVVLKWLPDTAKTPSSYIPLVSHRFQSTFRGWSMIYARSLNRSKMKPLCARVICQHPNHWDTPGNPGFFVMLAIHRAGYGNSSSNRYTAGICLGRVTRTVLSGAALKRYTWEIFLYAVKWCKSQQIFSLEAMDRGTQKAILISHLCLKLPKQEMNNLWGRRKTAGSTGLSGEWSFHDLSVLRLIFYLNYLFRATGLCTKHTSGSIFLQHFERFWRQKERH